MYNQDRTDTINLPPDEPRCQPSTPCSMRGDCARFKAALPKTGAILKDYSLEPCGGSWFCDGYTSARNWGWGPEPRKPRRGDEDVAGPDAAGADLRADHGAGGAGIHGGRAGAEPSQAAAGNSQGRRGADSAVVTKPTPADTLRREQGRAAREALEAALALQLRAHRLDAGMRRQHRPFQEIGYVFDFAWPERDPAVLVEVQGGIWTGGAHARPQGVLRDMDKANRANLAGACLLQVSAADIKTGRAVELIRQALAQQGEAAD
jgi:hypothetical protein